MADAAVRVDIVVGKNTVVPAVEQTRAALNGVSAAGRRANFDFESLNRSGLKKLEGGFKSLAFAASGVSGPMGKLIEGALLLGAGSTVVLGVAAGAAIITKVLQAIKQKAGEAELALLGATKALEEFLNPKNPLQGQIDILNDRIQILSLRMLSTFDPERLQAYNAEMVKLQKLLADVNAKQNPPGKPDKPAAGGGAPDALAQRIANTLSTGDRFGGPGKAGPADTIIALKEIAVVALEAVDPVNQLEQSINGLDVAFLNLTGVTLPQLGVAFSMAFIDAVAGANSFAEATIGAVRKAIAGTARLLGQEQFAKAAAKFAEGTWPPNPLAIASAIKHIAAGAAFNVLAGVVGGGSGGSGISGRAASGGVNSGQQQQDQQGMVRGTVTVKFGKGGFIDPRSPEFQEFMAEVFKEAKGRNVVFA